MAQRGQTADRGDGEKGGAAPDQLPVLGPGAHRTPAHGACVMEYASVLAGERFGDHPACTHRALADLARRVNDTVVTRHPERLALLAPSLVGTASPDPLIADVVVRACARAALAVEPGDRRAARLVRRAERALARVPRAGTRSGRAAAVLGRFGAGPSTAFAELWAVAFRLDRREQRDDLMIAALEQAVRDVRHHLGLTARPVRVTASPVPSRSGRPV